MSTNVWAGLGGATGGALLWDMSPSSRLPLRLVNRNQEKEPLRRCGGGVNAWRHCSAAP